MTGSDTSGAKKRTSKGSFVTRELQLSISVIVIMSLLGGLVLQTFSTAIIRHYGIGTPILGLILIVGYVVIVLLIAVFFAHKFVGPFKRIEYEMKLISSGELSRRLSVRGRDDLHVRHFVTKINDFVGDFEEMSKEYNNLNSLIDNKLTGIAGELSKEDRDCDKLREEIETLQREIHKLREKW